MAEYKTGEQFDRDARWFEIHQAKLAEQYPGQWVSIKSRRVVAVAPDPVQLETILEGRGMRLSHTFHQPVIGSEAFLEEVMAGITPRTAEEDTEIAEVLNGMRADGDWLDSHDAEFRERYSGRSIAIRHQTVIGEAVDGRELIKDLIDRRVIRFDDPRTHAIIGRSYSAGPEELL